MIIDVVFTPSPHISRNIRRYEGFKKYRFICTYHSIKAGDIISSPNYDGYMIVTATYPEDERTIHKGIPLKVLVIDTMNGEKLSSIQLNTTEEITDKRNISITLEQARACYKGGNETLKKLALSAYSEEELQPASYESIMKEISCMTSCSCLTYPSRDKRTVKALNKLRSIAAFFNKGWEKCTEGNGYFVTPNSVLEYNVVTKKYGWLVLQHEKVKYPGIIYFKSSEDAVKALKIAYTEGWLNDLK